MENETTLPGILTVPGELLHQTAGRTGRRRHLLIVAGAVLCALLITVWFVLR